MADLDLQVRGRESHKNFFSALRASVWSKNKGGPPLDSPLVHKGRVDYVHRLNKGVPPGKSITKHYFAFSTYHPKTCSFNYIKALSQRCRWIFALY